MNTTQRYKKTAFFNSAGFFFAVGLITFNIMTARAAPVDPRLDGAWVGVEVFPAEGRFTWIGATPQTRAVILISNSGQDVRVLSGFVPGKYWVSPKSSGSSLVYYGSNGRQGRKECRLELSPDGNTLKETGFVLRKIDPLVDTQHNSIASTFSCPVYATLKRVATAPTQRAKKPRS
jgi:hypothetical protein